VPNTVLHPLGPYSSDKALYKQIFKAQHPIARHADDPVGLPDPTLWMWTGPWMVQPRQVITTSGRQVQSRALEEEDGWFYAFDWPSEFHPDPRRFYSNVRRRKWERSMRELTALEFFQRFVAQGFSKESLQKACESPGCISSDGKINFPLVLSALTHAAATKGHGTASSPLASLGGTTGVFKTDTATSLDENAKDLDSNQLWLETLAKSCQIMNLSYDMILNARLTMFLKHFMDSAPPSSKQKSGGGPEPLWVLGKCGQNKDHSSPKLTARGAVMFRSLFTDMSCTSLIFDGDENGTDTFVTHILKLVMENHHDLCSSALTVLRRELSE
jgi:hypothetical protein